MAPIGSHDGAQDQEMLQCPQTLFPRRGWGLGMDYCLARPLCMKLINFNLFPSTLVNIINLFLSALLIFTAAEAVNKDRPSEPEKEGGAPKPANLPDPKANQL